MGLIDIILVNYCSDNKEAEYLLIYLLYLITYSLHAAQSFLRR